MFKLALFASSVVMTFGCQSRSEIEKIKTEDAQVSPNLPPPYETKSTRNYSNVIGWKDGRTPNAPAGFKVTKFADGFDNPRWLYITPNGDILVAEANSVHGTVEKILGTVVGANKSNNLGPSANRITLLRESQSPLYREKMLEGLNQPFGMLVLGNWLYVANTDALLRFPYKPGQTKISAKGEKLVDLPAGKKNRHWARNLLASPDGKKIYVSVGSASNVGEDGLDIEINRAAILEVNPDGTGLRVYASGLRNVNGMKWAPGTRNMWVVVNERDELGDELVPDYLTKVVENGFYGWPFSYWGQHVDPRVEKKEPERVKKAIVPDLSLGSHHAPLGMTFYTQTKFPKKYQSGAFIAEHGSWNRKKLAGYRVAFVPFANGKPSGVAEDFLTGFVEGSDDKKVFGRPVDVIMTPEGSLLVTDDVTNTVWKVSHVGK